MPTSKEVSAAKKSFTAEFWKPPWQEYISSIGISTVGLWSEGEVPDDEKDLLCIAVGLVKKPPKKIVFPTTHKDVPVRLLITGRAYALSG